MHGKKKLLDDGKIAWKKKKEKRKKKIHASIIIYVVLKSLAISFSIYINY
jgi:hypothetical protein